MIETAIRAIPVRQLRYAAFFNQSKFPAESCGPLSSSASGAFFASMRFMSSRSSPHERQYLCFDDVVLPQLGQYMSDLRILYSIFLNLSLKACSLINPSASC